MRRRNRGSVALPLVLRHILSQVSSLAQVSHHSFLIAGREYPRSSVGRECTHIHGRVLRARVECRQIKKHKQS